VPLIGLAPKVRLPDPAWKPAPTDIPVAVSAMSTRWVLARLLIVAEAPPIPAAVAAALTVTVWLVEFQTPPRACMVPGVDQAPVMEV